MANEEHLAMLKKGVAAWNQWRGENPEIVPDLSGINIKEADLGSAKIYEKKLYIADLAGVNLERTNLFGANLKSAYLAGANLKGADLTEASLVRVYLVGAKLIGATLKKANLEKANLGGANLVDAKLEETNLGKANLERANLKKATFEKADTAGANFFKANLQEANLKGANISEADLFFANLSGANLFGAKLSGADLSGADLEGASLSFSNFTSSDLVETNFANARLRETTFANVDLRQAKNLDKVDHIGPSYIDIHTLYLSQGAIPEAFLKGAGLDDNFISHIPSFFGGRMIQYYSCFISYSSKDEEFAKRIHADLQASNVRCWFAPHDMKIGDKIRPAIDEAIRLRDKVLIVLSQNSIESNWVEKEVETAFDEEGRRKKTVLFPVRIDNTVMESKEAWAADIRRQRHIGDFTKWEDHNSYKTTFERLLRDLRAA